MPTPRDSTEERLSPLEPHPHISCPPESIDHPAQWSQQVLGDIESATVDATTSGDSAPDRDPIDGLPPSAFDSCADGLETTRPSNRPISRSTVDSTFSPLARSPCDISHEEQETAKVQAINEAPSALKLSYSDRYGIVSPRVRSEIDMICFPLIISSSFIRTLPVSSVMAADIRALKRQINNSTMLR